MRRLLCCIAQRSLLDVFAEHISRCELKSDCTLIAKSVGAIREQNNLKWREIVTHNGLAILMRRHAIVAALRHCAEIASQFIYGTYSAISARSSLMKYLGEGNLTKHAKTNTKNSHSPKLSRIHEQNITDYYEIYVYRSHGRNNDASAYVKGENEKSRQSQNLLRHERAR